MKEELGVVFGGAVDLIETRLAESSDDSIRAEEIVNHMETIDLA